MNPARETKASGTEGGGSQRPPSAGPWWCSIRTLGSLVVLFLFALYPGVILGSHSFFYRDFGLFTYPVAYYTHQSFWRGELPLWNPLIDCGVPFLAQWNTTVCYPLSLIYMLFPLPWSLNYFCLGHLVLAGLGMYVLAFQWTHNRLAASIAGLAFALNGLMLNSLMWTSNLAALSWQPLVMVLVEKAWRQGGRHIAVAALAGGMQMLAGAPEIILFTWVLLAMLWLGQSWRREKEIWPALKRLVSVVALVAGLAAVQILPFLDLLAHSQRDASFNTGAWPMPLWGWANLIVPLFHCSPTVQGVYFQDGQTWTTSYYLGIGVLAFAILGAWRVREARTRWLAGVALAGLVLALGSKGVVYNWVKAVVPIIGLARYPIKFVALSVFAIPLLAAYGFDHLQTASVQGCRRGQFAIVAVTIFLVLAAGITLAVARLFPKPTDSWTATWQSGVSRTLVLVAIAGTTWFFVRARETRSRALLGIAVLLLIGFDAATAGQGQNPVVTTKAYGRLELNLSPRPRLGVSRAMVSNRARTFLGRADTADPLIYYVSVRSALFENCNLLENIPKVGGFSSLHLREAEGVLGLLHGRSNSIPVPLADFLGVAQVSASRSPFVWESRKSFLPLATAGQQPTFADGATALKELGSPDFKPRQVVYLSLSARSQMTVTDSTLAKVNTQTYTSREAKLTVEAEAPALVVIAQSYYHNWRAFVDAHPVHLWRANHAFQALEIPAGQHVVTLVYEDWGFRIGAIISCVAFWTCLGCLAFPKLRSAFPLGFTRGRLFKYGR